MKLGYKSTCQGGQFCQGGGDNSVRDADNSVRNADNSVTQENKDKENKDKENKDKEKAYTPEEVVKYRYKPTCHGKPFCPKCGQYQHQPRREQKLPVEANMSRKCPRNAAVLAVKGYKKPKYTAVGHRQPRRGQKLPIEANMSGKCPRNAAVLAVKGYKEPKYTAAGRRPP